MVRRILILLIISVIPLLHAADQDETRYVEGPIPSWVTPCEVSLEPIPIKPSQTKFQLLLSDYQYNWEEKTGFSHVAFKVLNRAGIQDHSEIGWTFVPSYQHLIVHQLRVYRDGQWVDRLGTSRHQLIQRENELEQKIYDGHLTLVYFLEDIRVGDIIEYSYSSVGENPIISSHLATSMGFQKEYIMEKVYRRLLVHPAKECQIKAFNTSLEPCINDLSPNLREYVWETTGAAACSWEKHMPDWYSGIARALISQYKTWGELAKNKASIYSLSPDFLDHPPEEMMALVNTWKETTADPSQRALLALRFVQDHVRYMGFEEGLDEYKPREPALVFQRRFGDCKDKAFLLHALLKLMDIDSTPALVHSRIGKRIHESLPSPSAFDHVILQITLGDKAYWVDGTISLQGGSLQDNYIPHFHHALLISDKTTDLTPLPAYTPLKPTELESSYVISSPEFAEMKYSNTFYGPNAEYMRRLIERKGLEKLSEEWVDDIQKKFRGASALSPPVVQDDRERNILTLQESYKIYTKELKGEKVLRPCSFIIEDYLDNYVNLERKTPYSLNYPLWVKERIHIENPRSSWLEESESTEIKHQTLNFSYDYKSKNHAVDFEYELKHVDDHIPVDLIKGYWNIINKIEEKAPGNIKIDPTPIVSEFIFMFLNWIGLILIPWFLYSCLIYRQKRKKGYLF